MKIPSVDTVLEGDQLSTGLQEAGSLDEPSHLVVFKDKQWAMWRWVCLRGAGFPASDVIKLSSPQCAGAADAIFAAEEALTRKRAEALDAVNKGLDNLRAESHWDNAEVRAPMIRAMRLLRAGKTPEEPVDDANACRAMADLRLARAAVPAAQAEFGRAFDAATAETSAAVREFLATDQYREAIVWQNRRAFNGGIRTLMENQPGTNRRDSKQRQHEELVANYVQRYCLKNDTIGFFGPVGWAMIATEGEAIAVRPQPDLLAERTVYFEGWCIDQIAETLTKKAGIKPWLIPSLLPYVRLEGTTVRLPGDRRTSVSPMLAAVLTECDGQRFAKEIVHELLKTPIGIRGEDEAYAALEQLSRGGLIHWSIRIPVDGRPERYLRRALAQIEDDELRGEAVEPLDQMEEARARVAGAAGNAAQLNDALRHLEETFTRITGAAATRAAGEIYAGRTLVFEDCRRNIDVEIGPEITDALEPPLALLFASGRWLTYQMASLYREQFTELYRELARKSGSREIDATTFWERMMPFFYDELSGAASLIGVMQDRWREIFDVPSGQRRAQYTSESLKPKVLRAFAAPRAGWQSSRYHSPDIMIAAKSVDEIRRGNYELVMGEIHAGINTLGAWLFLEQHPNKESLMRAVDLDLAHPRLISVNAKTTGHTTLRTRNELKSPKDCHIVLAHDSVPHPSANALPVSAFVVADDGAGLELRTKDGRIRFEAIESLGGIFSGWLANKFSLLAPTPHSPRITIDRLVVCRESWSYPAEELEFAFEKDSATRFLEARRWGRANAMPRFMFVKVPVEHKPFYVDFDSPIYVNIFTKMVRLTYEDETGDGLVKMSEMFPSAEELWLHDAAGTRYTSELRFVGLDLTQ